MNRRGIILDYHINRTNDAGEDDEIILEVRGIVNYGYPAFIGNLPENSYPAEGDEVEYDLLLNGKEWEGELTGKETDELEQMLLNAAFDYDDDEPEPSSDSYDDRKEWRDAVNYEDYDD
jgi:hypothetical protein